MKYRIIFSILLILVVVGGFILTNKDTESALQTDQAPVQSEPEHNGSAPTSTFNGI